jgi:hypothetical protein
MRYKGAEHPARKSPHWRGSSIGYEDPRTEIGELADPIRFPLEEVEKIEAQMMIEGGSDAVAAQFDQWPLEVSARGSRSSGCRSSSRTRCRPMCRSASAASTSAAAAIEEGRSDGVRAVARGTERRSSTCGTRDEARLARRRRGVHPQQHADDPTDVDWSLPEDPGTGKLYADYIVREIGAGAVRAHEPRGQGQGHAREAGQRAGRSTATS